MTLSEGPGWVVDGAAAVVEGVGEAGVAGAAVPGPLV
jgi:hypothetical protein